MVIDVHTHLNNYDTSKTVPLSERLDQLQESIRYNKVDQVLVLTSYKVDEHRPANPRLKILICHIGNPWIRDCMEVVYKNKNCVADISGLVLGDFKSHFKRFMLQQVKEMILYAGEPEYLLYGTDWPICRMRTYLKFVQELGLPPESREKILWKNAVRIFKLPVAPPAAAVNAETLHKASAGSGQA